MPLFGSVKKNDLLTELMRLAEGNLADLWSSIAMESKHGRPIRAVLFTGTDHGVGTTTLAVASAIGLARDTNTSTLLIESFVGSTRPADMLRVSPLEIAAQSPKPVANWHTGVVQTAIPRLHLLPAVNVEGVDAPTLVVKLTKIIEQACEEFEAVLIDLPPLRSYAPLRPIVSESSHAVVVARQGSSRKEDLRRTTEIISNSNVVLLGSILNHYQRAAPLMSLPARWRI